MSIGYVQIATVRAGKKSTVRVGIVESRISMRVPRCRSRGRALAGKIIVVVSPLRIMSVKTKSYRSDKVDNVFGFVSFAFGLRIF